MGLGEHLETMTDPGWDHSLVLPEDPLAGHQTQAVGTLLRQEMHFPAGRGLPALLECSGAVKPDAPPFLLLASALGMLVWSDSASFRGGRPVTRAWEKGLE